MSGQLSQNGAMWLANTISNNVPPHISTSAPTWIPGLVWINSNTNPGVLYTWNGSAWVSGGYSLYIAALTASPWTSGPSGGYAAAITDLVEDTTAGYSRQAVTFTDASSAYPAPVSNSSVLTFGPYTAAMTQADQWIALVTAASGTTGLLLYYWQLDTPQEVSVSQSWQIPAGSLTLTEN